MSLRAKSPMEIFKSWHVWWSRSVSGATTELTGQHIVSLCALTVLHLFNLFRPTDWLRAKTIKYYIMLPVQNNKQILYLIWIDLPNKLRTHLWQAWLLIPLPLGASFNPIKLRKTLNTIEPKLLVRGKSHGTNTPLYSSK